jgi:hypothetical protein
MMPKQRFVIPQAQTWATKKGAALGFVSRIKFQSSQVTSRAGLRTLHPAFVDQDINRPEVALNCGNHTLNAAMIAYFKVRRVCFSC